jgi:hypothetical protein
LEDPIASLLGYIGKKYNLLESLKLIRMYNEDETYFEPLQQFILPQIRRLITNVKRIKHHSVNCFPITTGNILQTAHNNIDLESAELNLDNI